MMKYVHINNQIISKYNDYKKVYIIYLPIKYTLFCNDEITFLFKLILYMMKYVHINNQIISKYNDYKKVYIIYLPIKYTLFCNDEITFLFKCICVATTKL